VNVGIVVAKVSLNSVVALNRLKTLFGASSDFGSLVRCPAKPMSSNRLSNICGETAAADQSPAHIPDDEVTRWVFGNVENRIGDKVGWYGGTPSVHTNLVRTLL